MKKFNLVIIIVSLVFNLNALAQEKGPEPKAKKNRVLQQESEELNRSGNIKLYGGIAAAVVGASWYSTSTTTVRDCSIGPDYCYDKKNIDGGKAYGGILLATLGVYLAINGYNEKVLAADRLNGFKMFNKEFDVALLPTESGGLALLKTTF